MKHTNANEATTVRVVYHDKGKSKDEYLVFANPARLDEWKKDENSVPLVNVVDSFEVFTNAFNKGTEGLLDRPSKSRLADTFGTEQNEEIVREILKKGSVKGGSFSSSATARDRAGPIKFEEFRSV